MKSAVDQAQRSEQVKRGSLDGGQLEHHTIVEGHQAEGVDGEISSRR